MNDDNFVIGYEYEITNRKLEETNLFKYIPNIPQNFEAEYFKFRYENGDLKKYEERENPLVKKALLEEEKYELELWFTTVNDIQTTKYVQGVYNGTQEDWEKLVEQAQKNRERINEINKILQEEF